MAAPEGGASCRCCMRDAKTVVSLFSRHRKTSVLLADMMRECCSLEVLQDDGMSCQICFKCSRRLKSAYKFRAMCHQVNNILMRMQESRKVEMVKTEIIEPIVSKPRDVKKPKTVKIETEDELNASETKHNLDYPIASKPLRDDEEKSNVEIPLKMENAESKVSSLETTAVRLVPKKKLKKAKKIIDKEKIKLRKTKMESRKNNVCLLCNRDCKDNTQLREHIDWVHKGKKYFCDICKKYYTSERDHKWTNHGPSKQCEHCGETFKSIVQHKVHMKAAHRHSDPQTCERCNAVFASKEGLIQHTNSIHGETKFICHYCSKSFNRKDKLDQHVYIHMKQRPHACDICNSMFSSNYELNRHRLRHTTERTMRCDHCTSVFKTREDLRKHIARHEEGIKRFSCNICGKLFRRSDHRNVHQRKVHKFEDLQAAS